ncbi:MAG TPA: hypothetical protein PLM14_15345 [Candidatus Hydrogenedentes bacterium]|nr:hypothetical protein [Candidatus Hydrogenedentota bacterium]HQE84374.1 hypothetical protein [Candidatus Hydrogenedentota bacterium]HQM48545.1 hypothetical protein [Candidatus Hydrogenedentota bacterium]
MEHRHEIRQLCESWWEHFAASAPDEQPRYAEGFLRLLGWHDFERIHPPGTCVSTSASYLLGAAGRPNLVAHFQKPGSLQPPSILAERGLDFCDPTRHLVTLTKSLRARYAFISDLFRFFLYDTQTEELLLCSDTPAEFAGEFEETLSCSEVVRGSLEELRRPPRSNVARQLREWCRRWENVLVSEGHVREETAGQALDRILVLRFLTGHNVLRRPGSMMRGRLNEIVALACTRGAAGCGRELVRLFRDLWVELGAEIFAPEPSLERALEGETITRPLLQELRLLARSKFTIPVILEKFNYGEAAEKARVRMVPEEDEDRLAYLHKQTSASIEEAQIKVDIEDEGYRAIFWWMDRLVALYERLGREYENKALHEHAGSDIDLFAWSEIDAAKPTTVADPYRHAIEKGMVVMYASLRQYRTARLLLYLHLIHAHASRRLKFDRFPKMEGVLQKRPSMTEADRRRLFSPVQKDEWNVG